MFTVNAFSPKAEEPTVGRVRQSAVKSTIFSPARNYAMPRVARLESFQSASSFGEIGGRRARRDVVRDNDQPLFLLVAVF